ncbi:MAG: sirohydrochlorin cobaltochelatase [Spirochaetaceae bacterium]|jgi:cobalamin biosynthesis Co2+ chelatase CbiK|nr:sirohydrochlorin cobaltochelatase [Spirochaetaceae bacterium]
MKDRKAILVVSFGTSYEETLTKTIFACEKELSAAFPEHDLKRAFTSFMIIRKLKRVEGLDVDTPAIAMEKLRLENYTHVLVQPLHIIPGDEYNQKVLEAIMPFTGKFKSLHIGKPLLYHHRDYEATLDAILSQLPVLKKRESIVFMGHGTGHPANSSYSCLQAIIDDRNLPIQIGCVEGYPYVDTILKRLKKRSINKIHLFPLMLVAGDHAQNDMAGENEDSWKSVFEKAGYETECHLVGLGENKLIQQCFINKAHMALEV